MVKNSIVNKILLNTDMDKESVEEIVGLIVEIIADTLEKKEAVKIYRFGTFQVSFKKKRIGRNPKNNDEIYEIASRYVVTFKPSKYFRKEIIDHLQANSVPQIQSVEHSKNRRFFAD